MPKFSDDLKDFCPHRLVKKEGGDAGVSFESRRFLRLVEANGFSTSHSALVTLLE